MKPDTPNDGGRWQLDTVRAAPEIHSPSPESLTRNGLQALEARLACIRRECGA